MATLYDWCHANTCFPRALRSSQQRKGKKHTHNSQPDPAIEGRAWDSRAPPYNGTGPLYLRDVTFTAHSWEAFHHLLTAADKCHQPRVRRQGGSRHPPIG
jgi:hypothetical protein